MMIGVGLCWNGRGEGQGVLEGKEKEKSVYTIREKGGKGKCVNNLEVREMSCR